MRKRLRVRGAFAPGAVLLQGRAACRSTRVGCEWGLTRVVGACSVRTGGGPAIRRCSYGGRRGSGCRSTRDGCEWGGAFKRAGHAVRTGGGAPTGGDPWVVGAPAPGAKGSACLIILARVFRWPPSPLHPTPPLLSSFPVSH